MFSESAIQTRAASWCRYLGGSNQSLSMLRSTLIVATLATVRGLIACAYRCDPQWAGLDNGACIDDDSCPDTMDPVVTNPNDGICAGLPYEPSPGDILFHDAVLFSDVDDCNSYIAAWENNDALTKRRRIYAAYANKTKLQYQADVSSMVEVADQDKVGYDKRGETWSGILQGLAAKCIGIGGEASASCKNWTQVLQSGMNGGQLRDCLQDCAAMEGLDVLEDYACKYAAVYLGVGEGADIICQGVEKLLEPVNKWVDTHVVQPVIKVADKVEDAIASAGHAIGHFFHFW